MKRGPEFTENTSRPLFQKSEQMMKEMIVAGVAAGLVVL